MNDYLFTALLAFLPISEVRGAIPYAYLNNLNFPPALLIAVLSNMTVPVLFFLFLQTLHGKLMKFNFYNRFFTRFIDRTQKRISSKINKYGYLGLTLFVAVPLPITGAWTAALGAFFLGLKKVKSIVAIWIGIVIASTIVTAVILTGSNLSSLFVNYNHGVQ